MLGENNGMELWEPSTFQSRTVTKKEKIHCSFLKFHLHHILIHLIEFKCQCLPYNAYLSCIKKVIVLIVNERESVNPANLWISWGRAEVMFTVPLWARHTFKTKFLQQSVTNGSLTRISLCTTLLTSKTDPTFDPSFGNLLTARSTNQLIEQVFQQERLATQIVLTPLRLPNWDFK